MVAGGRTRRDPWPARPSSVGRPLTPPPSSPCTSNSPRRRRFRRRSPNINLASLADQATQLQTIVLAHAPAATQRILDLLPGRCNRSLPRLRLSWARRFRASGAPSLHSASAPPCRSSATGSSPRVRKIIGPPPTSAAGALCRRMSGREASLLFSNGLSRDRRHSAPRLRGEGIRPPARRSCNRLEAEKTWST
jgi:hypothetical protein